MAAQSGLAIAALQLDVTEHLASFPQFFLEAPHSRLSASAAERKRCRPSCKHQRIYTMTKIEVEISDDDAKLIAQALQLMSHSDANTHGKLDLPRLAAMLLEDVALAMSRPGSWEGAHMIQVLESHGYPFG
jgi:hypothetical protein